MAVAKQGDVVHVHYTGKLVSGEIFDSSEGRDPLAFTVGGGEVIPGFDEAVTGMQIGESKDVVIPVQQAYGERREELTQTVPRDLVQLGTDPQVGMQIEMHRQDGTVIPLLITHVDETSITVDANHPLAGEELHFNIQLAAIAGM
ncbi:MAG: peptidylprolyl isomerase [Blastocatellia bacterium]|nr:peptidylprolyl isomerase [Blastocatellia bacterium]